VSRALFYSLAACAVSVGLEALFAGSGIKQRLAELRVPRFAPQLWGWVVIGILYYVTCFVVLYRLFAIPQETAMRSWALGAAFALMFINALWNYFFFRTRNLFHAFLISLPYALIALALFLLLLGLDRPAAFCLVPYLLYLFYAGTFGYRVSKLNPPAGA
jgi:benzodiazapine receptor